MAEMKYEINFYDEDDGVVEGYFYADGDIEDVIASAMERADEEGVFEWEHAEVVDYETSDVLATCDGGTSVDDWEIL